MLVGNVLVVIGRGWDKELRRRGGHFVASGDFERRTEGRVADRIRNPIVGKECRLGQRVERRIPHFGREPTLNWNLIQTTGKDD